MVVCYLDTSAILKRYRTEKGTEVVEGLYDLRDGFLVASHGAIRRS
jgi:predicted nucleic acid-binding protein